MTIGRGPAKGLVCAVLVAIIACAGWSVGSAEQSGQLELQKPEDVRVWREYNPVGRNFTVYLTWEDIPDSCGTFIHEPDTTGWGLEHLPAEMSIPTSSGIYSGDTDRTVSFRALDSGQVGIASSIRLKYEVIREEYYNGQIDVGASYVPGTPIPVIFRDERDSQARIDFGLRITLSDGWVDGQGRFLVGLEDFEGYHLWRGIRSDGSDLTIIGELSKQEAARGSRTGGSIADSIYYYSVIPTLRDSLTWYSDFGSVDCLGQRIKLDLTDTQLMWYDCDVFNGFTYYYAVTTFDRDYLVGSGRQGLTKFDHCQPAQGIPYECEDELARLPVEVDPQNDVSRVYAVPNPYRSGGSRLTQKNYHNFPDNEVRFVNVPAQATLRIYTVAGDLVWEHEHDGIGGNLEWNVRNGNDEPVSSGVYIYKLEAGNGDIVYGRLVVIR